MVRMCWDMMQSFAVEKVLTIHDLQEFGLVVVEVTLPLVTDDAAHAH